MEWTKVHLSITWHQTFCLYGKNLPEASLASCLQNTGEFAFPVLILPFSMLNWCFIAFCTRYFSWWKRFKAMMRWKDYDCIRVHRHRILKAKMIATSIVDLFPVKTTLLPLEIFSMWYSSWMDCVNLLTIHPDWLQTNCLSFERQIRHFESHATKHGSHAIITIASRVVSGASFILSPMLLLP